MEKPTESERAKRVIEFIENLNKLDKGALAQLRRNAGRQLEEAHNVFGIFFRILPYGVKNKEIYFLVATLYPLTESANSGNFGDTMRKARMEGSSERGIDRRMELLLDADEDELPYRLYHAVQFAKAKGVGINWKKLLEDLLNWHWPERRVQLEWAQAYFPEPAKAKSQSNQAPNQ